jgi:outer membrane receptor for ferrienterochelin and colicins
MKFKIILLLMVAFNIHTVFGQNTFKSVIKDSKTKEPLIGATAILSGTTTGATADIDGLITLTNIPNGKQIIEFRYIGYEIRKDTFEFPLATSDPIEIFLQSETDELDEIVDFIYPKFQNHKGHSDKN